MKLGFLNGWSRFSQNGMWLAVASCCGGSLDRFDGEKFEVWSGWRCVLGCEELKVKSDKRQRKTHGTRFIDICFAAGRFALLF